MIANDHLICVIDLGTSCVRGVIVDDNGHIIAQKQVETLPLTPASGLVEQDANDLVDCAVGVAVGAIEAAGNPDIAGLGIAVQRATTVVWDALTGDPVGPAIGWADLRTLGDCLALGAKGIRMPPNASGSKAAFLVQQGMNMGVPTDRLRFGTLDTWLAWKLTAGAVHVTDPTNAGVTGMLAPDASSWDLSIAQALQLPHFTLPAIVPTSGICGTARLGARDVPLAALVGDQQASLIGQGGLRPGVVKTTYGTACMTDVNLGGKMPPFAEFASYPIVVATTTQEVFYGLEATVITGGEAVRGLVDLGLAATPAQVDALARSVPDAAGVQFVPALLGLGTPYWDFGARGSLIGMTLGTERAHIARAVLEGIASRVTECVRQIESDGALNVERLRVDGGAAVSDVLCQAQADRLGIPVDRSAEREATALGAALLAGLATGIYDADDVRSIPQVEHTFEPLWDDTRRAEHEASWQRSIAAAREWIPEMSAIRF